MRGEKLNVSILILLVNLGFAIRSATQQLIWSKFLLNEFLILLLHSVLHQTAAAWLLYVLLHVKIWSDSVEKASGYYTRLPNSFKLGLLGFAFLYIVKHQGVVRVLMVSLITARALSQLFSTSKVVKVVNKLIDKTGLSTVKKSTKPAEGNYLPQRNDYLPSGTKTPASISRISNVRGVTPHTDFISKRLFNDNDHTDNKKPPRSNGVSFYNNSSIWMDEKPTRRPRSTPYHTQNSQRSSISRRHGSTGNSSRDDKVESRNVEQQEPVDIPKTTSDRAYNTYTELVQPLMATSGTAFNYAKEYSANMLSSLSSYMPVPSKNKASEVVSEAMDRERARTSPQKGSSRKRLNSDSAASPSKRSNDKGRYQQVDGGETEIETSRPFDKSVTFTGTDTEGTQPVRSGRSPKNARNNLGTLAGSSIASSVTSFDSNDTTILRRNNSTTSTTSTISFSGLNSDGLNIGTAYKRRKAIASLGYSNTSDQSSIIEDDFVMRRKYTENLVTADMKQSRSEKNSSSSHAAAVPAYSAPSIDGTSFMLNKAPEVAARSTKEELIDEKTNTVPKSSGFSIFTDSSGSAAAPIVPLVDVLKPFVDFPTAGKIDRVESALFPQLDDSAFTNKLVSGGGTSTAPAMSAPSAISILPEYSPNKSATGVPKVSPSKKPPPSPIVTGGEVPGIAFNSLGKNSNGFGSTQAVEVNTAINTTTFVAANIFGAANSVASSSQLPPLSLPLAQPPAKPVNLFGNDVSVDSAAKNTISNGISGIFPAASTTAVPHTSGGLSNPGGFSLAATSSTVPSAMPSAGGFNFGGATANTTAPAAAATVNLGGFGFGGVGGAHAPTSSAAVNNTTTSSMPATSNTGFSFGTASAPAAGSNGGMIATSTSSVNNNSIIFGGASSGAFGPTSAAASTTAAPASNLFGSSYGTTTAPLTFGLTTQGSSNGIGSSTNTSTFGGAPSGPLSLVPAVASNVAVNASTGLSMPSSASSFGGVTAPPANFGTAGSIASSTNSAAPMVGFNQGSSTMPFAGSMSMPGGSFSSVPAVASNVAVNASNLYSGSGLSMQGSGLSMPSASSFGGVTAPPANFAVAGSFASSTNSAAPMTGFNQSSISAISQGPVMFGSLPANTGSVPAAASNVAGPASNLFGSTPSFGFPNAGAPQVTGSVPAVASNVAGPASNLFGSTPSFGFTAGTLNAAPFAFGATSLGQGTTFMGSQNQPPNAGMMGASSGMFSLGTTEKKILRAKKK